MHQSSISNRTTFWGAGQLNTEIFYTLKEAKVLIERWRHHYNTIRPHSSLGYRPPAPETVLPATHVPAYAIKGFGRNAKPRQPLT